MSRGSSGQTERFPSEAISRTQVAFGRNCLTRRMFSFFLGRSMNSSPANDSLSQAAVLLRRTKAVPARFESAGSQRVKDERIFVY